MKVLIADDDRDIAGLLALFLSDAGHQVVTVTTGGLDVMHQYDRCQPDVVLMDVMMPRFNGLTISHAILSKDPHAKLVLMSGKFSADHPFIANSGALHFLPKPLHLTALKTLLDEFAGTQQAAA